MKKIILLLVLLLVFLSYFKSRVTQIDSNILIMACYIKKNNLKVIQNNLDYFKNKCKLIIFVYSVEDGYVFNKDDIISDKIVFIHDKQNKYYDFYKYKLAYDYIKQNNIQFNWVFVTNDSIIICDDISWIINKIESSDKEYIGILEVNDNLIKPFKIHYQSWWLNFKKIHLITG